MEKSNNAASTFHPLNLPAGSDVDSDADAVSDSDADAGPEKQVNKKGRVFGNEEVYFLWLKINGG